MTNKKLLLPLGIVGIDDGDRRVHSAVYTTHDGRAILTIRCTGSLT